MRTHSMIFFNQFKEYKYYLGLSYNILGRNFGYFLCTNLQPPLYYDLFKKDKDNYIMKNNFIHIPKNFTFAHYPESRNIYNPMQIVLEDLITMFVESTPDVVFYTGAGLSKGAGIKDLKELESFLYISDFLSLNRIIIEDPGALRNNYVTFIMTLYLASPTIGHKLIKNLQDEFAITLITENRDTLHQKTGSVLIERDQIKKTDLKRNKLLITLGLDKDHQGVISYLRNFNCKIVAVNLIKPGYLHNEDYWLQYDINECLKELVEVVMGG